MIIFDFVFFSIIQRERLKKKIFHASRQLRIKRISQIIKNTLEYRKFVFGLLFRKSDFIQENKKNITIFEGFIWEQVRNED